MSSQLRFHPKVVDDLKGAVEWYDARSAGADAYYRVALEVVERG